jgi:hypothetical protein
MRSPGFSVCSSTRLPFTQVPFVLPRSRSTQCPGWQVISA